MMAYSFVKSMVLERIISIKNKLKEKFKTKMN